uniref:Cytochrome c oxidase assembly factor 1 homolog n=1 Tax=Sus scrofa TaxID=9823 RepID=A0A8D0RMW8_PIG
MCSSCFVLHPVIEDILNYARYPIRLRTRFHVLFEVCMSVCFSIIRMSWEISGLLGMYMYTFFFFFFSHAHSTWTFPSQGSNLSYSCDLHCSCSNTGSLTRWAIAGSPVHAPVTGTVKQVPAGLFLTHTPPGGFDSSRFFEGRVYSSHVFWQLSFGDCQGRWAAKWQKGTRVLGPGSPPACPQVRQQSPGSRMSVPLGKLVFFSSVATSGTCTLLYFLIQKMFSRASYYQLALEHLHSHAEALEALGTPLSVHYLQLTDKYNFEDIADAQLKIPVSGPKSEGHLYVSSSREGPFRRWNLQEVFLELRDGHRIPVFKPSGEGPAR